MALCFLSRGLSTFGPSACRAVTVCGRVSCPQWCLPGPAPITACSVPPAPLSAPGPSSVPFPCLAAPPFRSRCSQALGAEGPILLVSSSWQTGGFVKTVVLSRHHQPLEHSVCSAAAPSSAPVSRHDLLSSTLCPQTTHPGTSSFLPTLQKPSPAPATF